MIFYFLGICGTAMGNVAIMLKSMRYNIVGADLNCYPPISDSLQKANIPIYEGYDAKRLEALAPHKVIIGNALSRGNPEIEWLLEKRTIPFCSLPEFLSQTLLFNRKNIVITGTHGKTTTTALATHFLKTLGENPGYLIGGVPLNFPSGAFSGENNSPFVIEGDEYDTAFFDKRSKFIHYNPHILVINNIEFDHGDIFRDLTDVIRTFKHLCQIVPKNGYVLVNGDDPNTQQILPLPWTHVRTIGTNPDNDLIIKNFCPSPEGSSFELLYNGTYWGHIQTPLTGLYNARNIAMAALASALYLHPQNPTKVTLNTFSSFKGVKRRQEIVFKNEKLLLIEDFAHHPTALAETLTSLKERYNDYEIISCVEPRSHTFCRHFHQKTLPKALQTSNHVLLAPVYKTQTGSPKQTLNTAFVCEKLNTLGTNACTYTSCEDLFTGLKDLLSKKNNKKKLVCFFTNGSFEGLIQKVTDFLTHLPAE